MTHNVTYTNPPFLVDLFYGVAKCSIYLAIAPAWVFGSELALAYLGSNFMIFAGVASCAAFWHYSNKALKYLVEDLWGYRIVSVQEQNEQRSNEEARRQMQQRQEFARSYPPLYQWGMPNPKAFPNISSEIDSVKNLNYTWRNNKKNKNDVKTPEHHEVEQQSTRRRIRRA